MIRGVIIEGLSTSGKTSMLSALKKAQANASNVERTLLVISEHYSQVLHSYHGVLRSMKREEHIELLFRHVDYLEKLHNWIDSLGHSTRSNGIFYVLERFHLNHLHAFGSSEEIQSLDERLARLNASCVLLTLSSLFT